jgi:ABC-type antimicrobial peptide transport system permease subunit
MIGWPAAIGAGWVIGSQLFGVRPWDSTGLGCASLLLVTVMIAVGSIPAQRAASMNPVGALRAE